MKRTQTIAYLIDFISSEGKDVEALKSACNTNTNLKIYLCLSEDELLSFAKKFKKFKVPSELLEQMIKKQPSINISVEVYDKVVESVRNDMEQYFKYNGFKMANAWGDQEDWISHFLVKYYYFSNFYRDRWFFPENLKKATKVKKTYKKYSDFLNLARKSITEERKVWARKCAENPEATLRKGSVDTPMFQNNQRITMLDITSNPETSEDHMFDSYHEALSIKRKIMSLAEDYENGRYAKKIRMMLDTGECKGKKIELVLLKIFAYKSGVVTVKSLKFINSLSRTYKEKFGISSALLNKQMRELGIKK